MNKLKSILSVYILSLLIYSGCNQPSQNPSTEENVSQEKRIQVVENNAEDRVDVRIDGTIFTSYIYPESVKKPILYPVYTSSGIKITRGFPLDPQPWERVDHPHHVGIWLNHGDVNDLDFWNNSESIPSDRKMHYGTIYHKSIKDTESGNEKGSLEVTSEWKRPDGRILIQENSKFYFWGEENIRIIDRITTLTASEISVLFKDSKEGMIAIRVIRELEQAAGETLTLLNENLETVQVNPNDDNRSTGLYESSEGLQGDDVWGTRARWVKLGSKYENNHIGIVIMDHPENPNHPTHWHARGYGLFGANPFGSRVFTDGRESLNYFLSSGKSVTFKYRLYIYDGFNPDGETINKNYEEFVSLYESQNEK